MNAELKTLLDSVSEPMLIHDGSGKIVGHNSQILILYSLSRGVSLVGRNEFEWISKEDKPAVKKRIQQLLSTGSQPIALETLVTPSGRRVVIVSANRIPATKLIAVRFLPLPQEAKDWLHDLKNQMCLIRWPLDDQSVLESSQIQKLKGQLDEVIMMTNQFLGRGEDWRQVKLTELFGSVERLAGMAARYLIIQTAPDVSFRADETGLRMALLNLVTNAFEHGLRGRNHVGVIELSAAVVEARKIVEPQDDGEIKADRFLHIRVANDGAGLDGSSLQKIRAKLAGTDQLAGRGLGLPHVGKIARRHGGWAAVVSVPGLGTCFSLYIPLPV